MITLYVHRCTFIVVRSSLYVHRCTFNGVRTTLCINLAVMCVTTLIYGSSIPNEVHFSVVFYDCSLLRMAFHLHACALFMDNNYKFVKIFDIHI